MLPDKELQPLMETYQNILTQQLKLGHRSILMGYFHPLWQTTQHQYRKINFLPNKHQQAKTAITAIGFLLFKQVQTIWHVRNNQLHGHDINSQPQHKLALLQQQVRTLYKDQHLLMHVDRDLFSMPLEDRLRDNCHKLQEFLDFVTPLINPSKAAAKARDRRTKKPINQYFRRSPIPPHLLDLLQP